MGVNFMLDTTLHNGAMRPSPGFFAFPFFSELIVRCWDRIIFVALFLKTFIFVVFRQSRNYFVRATSNLSRIF